MKFKLEIECDNATFFDVDGESDPGPEITRILGWVVNDIGNGMFTKETHRVLRDINGNRVGSFGLVEDD